MPTIRQQIIDAIQTRFEGITVVNGYNSDMGLHISQWKATPLNADDFPALEYRDIACNRVDGAPIGFFRWALNMEIEIVTASGATTITDVREMLADVYKAIGTDETWGALAQWTEQPSDAVIIEQQDKIIGGAKILFNIVYDAPKWGM